MNNYVLFLNMILSYHIYNKIKEQKVLLNLFHIYSHKEFIKSKTIEI